MIPEIINLSETATPACPQCGARTVEEACTLGCKGEGMDNREIVETLATRVMWWLLSVVDCKLLADDPLQVKARVRKFGSPDSYASEADTEEMAVALACLKAVEGK